MLVRGVFVVAWLLATTAWAACPLGTYSNPPEPYCNPCPAGTYQTVSSVGYCYNCTDGSWSETGSASCTNASLGYYATTNHTMQIPCPPGSFVSTEGASASCTPAPAGTFVADSASADYQLCPTGTYSEIGATGCTSCESGTFCDEEGCSTCTPIACDPGTYQRGVNSSVCDQCEAGTYCDEENCTECSLPPAGFVVPLGLEASAPVECEDGLFADSNTSCVCAFEDHYANPTHTMQIPCPDGWEQPQRCQTACVRSGSSSSGGCTVCGIVIGVIGGVVFLGAAGLIIYRMYFAHPPSPPYLKLSPDPDI